MRYLVVLSVLDFLAVLSLLLVSMKVFTLRSMIATGPTRWGRSAPVLLAVILLAYAFFGTASSFSELHRVQVDLPVQLFLLNVAKRVAVSACFGLIYYVLRALAERQEYSRPSPALQVPPPSLALLQRLLTEIVAVSTQAQMLSILADVQKQSWLVLSSTSEKLSIVDCFFHAELEEKLLPEMSGTLENIFGPGLATLESLVRQAVADGSPHRLSSIIALRNSVQVNVRVVAEGYKVFVFLSDPSSR
jgi:hypothetical protein